MAKLSPKSFYRIFVYQLRIIELIDSLGRSFWSVYKVINYETLGKLKICALLVGGMRCQSIF